MTEKFAQLAKEIHRPMKKTFPRRQIITGSVGELLSADIADMSVDFIDDGFRYFLIAIDVYSKYIWTVPLKQKSANEVTKAFKKIFETETLVLPSALWTDQGKEFTNREFQKFLEALGIVFFHTFGEGKSVPAERAIRTIKTEIWREFTTYQTREWVDLLPEIVHNYNHRKHGTTKLTPFEVYTRAKFYKPKEKDFKSKTKFKIGDYVRVSRIKMPFEKGFHGNWSHEIFQIRNVLPTNPVTYSLNDFAGDKIQGSFYNEELQKTELTDVFLVDKVIKRKGDQSLVKWLGWPDKFNSWVPNSDLKDIQKKK